ncbi:MAG: hypothetical protein IKF45_01880 [Lachnospiraceae bacterium]|nr:hypothetical protein [Lachnospiraceae bacterium]
MEDKQRICDLLLPVLQATRDLYDLQKLVYSRINEYDEIVTATFANGYEKRANVSMDSGIAMIRDICRQIS